ncbi:MAG: GumC family protein [Rhodothalassiaceae bacterium]
MRHRSAPLPPPAGRGAARVRLLLFVGVFAAVLVAGLAYVFARSPVYESRAALRITVAGPAKTGLPPALADTALAERAARTEVAVEHHQLLSHDVLQATAQRLDETVENPETAPDLATLARAISIQPDAQSDIVTLRARGSDPTVLPPILAAWIGVYRETQTGQQRADFDDTVAKLRGQMQTLETRLVAKRDEIEAFRTDHDILSLQRDENRLAARLKGLTQSLNTARQDVITAEGEVDSIRAALEAGRVVFTNQDRARLAQLEDRLQEAEERVASLLNRFTLRYIELDPDLSAILRRRDELRADLEEVQSRAGDTVLAAAEQQLASARAALARLQRDYDASKAQIAAFTSRFEEYEELQAELRELEAANAAARQEALRRDIDADRGITQVSVLQAPSVPLEPIGPPYARDAAIVGAAALLLALLAVLLYDFFTRPARRDTDALHAEMQASLLGGLFAKLVPPRATGPDGRLIDATPQPLPEASARTAIAGPEALPAPLEEADLSGMLAQADAQTRLLLGLLLSGFAPEQLERLTVGALGRTDRPQRLPEPVRAALRAQSAALSDDACVFQHPDGTPLDLADVNAMLAAAAHDAGLPDPDRVDAALVLHSYRVYLVRQGLKLAELDRLAGPLPPRERLAYAAFAPPGPQRPAKAIDPVHPALKQTLAA